MGYHRISRAWCWARQSLGCDTVFYIIYNTFIRSWIQQSYIIDTFILRALCYKCMKYGDEKQAWIENIWLPLSGKFCWQNIFDIVSKIQLSMWNGMFLFSCFRKEHRVVKGSNWLIQRKLSFVWFPCGKVPCRKKHTITSIGEHGQATTSTQNSKI